METFKALRHIRGVRAILGMTLSQYNQDKFETTLRSCQHDCPGLNVKDFHINVMQVSQHYYHNSDLQSAVPTCDQALAEVRKYRILCGIPRTPTQWIESKYLKLLESFIETGITPMRCHALHSSCFIDPRGQVFPCITYCRPLGNLRDHDMNLDAVWNSAEAKQVQSEIWSGNCPQCWTACEAYQSILGNIISTAGYWLPRQFFWSAKRMERTPPT